jgi:peptidoglycan-N-acetylglucosamine deacetylase
VRSLIINANVSAAVNAYDVKPESIAPVASRSLKIRRAKWSTRKTIFAVALVSIPLAAQRVDRVAAALTFVAFACTIGVLKLRTHKAARGAGVVLGISAMAIGAIAALALPVYSESNVALIVNVPSEAEPLDAPPSPGVKRALPPISAHDGPLLIGFAATDYDETASDLDTTSRYLSVVASTGIRLGDKPGSIVVSALQDSVIRSHIAGARAYGVVTNYNGTDFDPQLVSKLLADSTAADRFVAAMATEVRADNLDGIVLDFEALPGSIRDQLPKLANSLKDALGKHSLLVAVPGTTDQNDSYSRGYDLAALAENSDGLILMAYDEHEMTGSAGSIGSLQWVREVITEARKVVPANKLVLGIPSFGYIWKGTAATSRGSSEITARDGIALVDGHGQQLPYDSVTGERHGTLADGSEAWFVDARGAQDRTKIATNAGFAGVALWRVGTEEAGTFQSLPISPRKENPVKPGRPIVQERNAGVVALTFDDGPDPTWTLQILRILREKHVPGTFFVVAKNAEKHQGLISDIIADGGVVANHTYSHLDTGTAAQWRTRIDIAAGRAVIEGITGKTPLLFRAPFGKGDTSATHKGSDDIAAELGMRAVGWNVDSFDWERKGVPAIQQAVLGSVTERSVVLLHDGGGDRSQTVAALPKIIDDLKARGFVFTTVDGIDASLTSSYSQRVTGWARFRGLVLIAAFRLQLAIRKLFLWLVVFTALAAFFRVLFAGPLAIMHVRQQKGRMAKLLALSARPTVTVLVPAFNEGKVIEKTLMTLSMCTPPPERIIVLDDGSTDDTADVARLAIDAINKRTDINIVVDLVVLKNGGKARALNTGTAMSTTDVVVVIDADTMVDPKLIEHLALHFRDPRVGAVAGNVKVGNRRNFFSAMQTLEYVIALNLDRRAQDIARVMAVVPGAAGAFRRSALLAAGGYPSDTLVEDADLTQALLRDGWRIPYEPQAVAWTEAPQSLKDVVKQRRRWSYGTIQVVNKHKRAILEPEAGLLGFIGLPWMLLTQVALPILGPLADVYLVYLVLIGARSQAFGILALAFAADLVLAIIAVAADREAPKIALMAPLLRLVWRPLQLWIVISSARRFARGESETWRKITRTNSVDLGRFSTAPVFPTSSSPTFASDQLPLTGDLAEVAA